MERMLAGLVGAPPADARRILMRALAPEGEATTWSANELAVGATESTGHAGSALPTCLVDGEVEGQSESLLGEEYGRRGEGTLARLRGSFAVVLCNPERGTGCVARDPLGGRPLYFTRTGSRAAFASEIRVLLRMLPTQPDVDRVAAATWLGRGGHPPGRTLLAGVGALGPGCLLSLSGTPEIRRYWAPRFSDSEPVAAADAAERLRQALDGSVERAIGEGQRVGVMFSGGLDSTTVASAAAGVLHQRGGSAPRAFTAAFPCHPEVDESALAERASSELGLSWTRADVRGGSALAAALDYQRTWDAPAPSPNRFFDQPLLRRAATEGVDVVLDGEGGDELFGASPFLVADRLASGRVRSAVPLAQDLAGEHATRGRVVARILARYGLRGLLPHGLHDAWRRNRDPLRYAPRWLTQETATLFLAGHDEWEWKRLDGPRWWAWLCHTLTSGREQAGIFTHLGREARAAGLRAGHPLLDLQLVDFVLRCPPALAFDRGVDRPLIRTAVRGRVPELVRLRRDKAQFNALQNDSLALADGKAVERLLGSSRALVNAYIDPQAVRDGPLAAMARHGRGGGGGWTMPVWRLVTLECWLRGLEDPGFADQALEDWGLDRPDISMTGPG